MLGLLADGFMDVSWLNEQLECFGFNANAVTGPPAEDPRLSANTPLDIFSHLRSTRRVFLKSLSSKLQLRLLMVRMSRG